MKKYIRLLTLSLLIIVFSLVLGACKGGGEEEAPPEVQVPFELVETSTTMIVGDEKQLPYYYNIEDDGGLKFVSSNENVALINSNGFITAMNPGSATITCTYGEHVKTFDVTVQTNGLLPTLDFQNVDNFEGENFLQISDTAYLKPVVLFNGKKYTDINIRYESSDTSKCTVSQDGVLTALGEGEVSVKVFVSWRWVQESELTSEITFNLVPKYEVIFGENEINNLELYLASSIGSQTYQTYLDLSSLSVKLNGENRTADATVSISDNQTISGSGTAVNYSEIDSKISASASGTAKINVELQDNGKTYSKSINVKVKRPVQQVSGTSYFELPKGIIENLTNYIDGSIESAYYNGDEFTGTRLTVDAQNKITGYTVANPKEMENQTFVVYDDGNVGYAFNLDIVQGIIRKASDLAQLYKGNQSLTSGYYVVVNDIIWDENDPETQFIAQPSVSTSSNNSTILYRNGSKFNLCDSFNGTFDGLGHRIEYGVSQAGLFGILCDGAVVKNASFIVKKIGEPYSENINHAAGRYTILAAAATYKIPNAANNSIQGTGVTIENVYATYDIENFYPKLDSLYGPGGRTDHAPAWFGQKQSRGEIYYGLGLISAQSERTKYSNVIVDMSKVKGVNEAIKDTTKEVQFGIFGGDSLDSRASSNGNDSAINCQIFNNCYVIWDVAMIAYCRIYNEFTTADDEATFGYKANTTYNKYAIRTYADGEKGSNAYSNVLGNGYDETWVALYDGPGSTVSARMNYSLNESVDLYRANGYSDLRKYFEEHEDKLYAFANICDISYGVPLPKGSADDVINDDFLRNNTVITLNDTDNFEITINAAERYTGEILASDWLGNPLQVSIEHTSGAELVVIEGNTIKYSTVLALGDEVLTVTATYSSGLTKTQQITIKARSMIELGEVYTDGVNTKFPSGLTPANLVLKSAEDERVLLYNTGAWDLPEKTTSNELGEYLANVYENGELLGSIKIKHADGVILEASDLAKVYGTTSGTKITGYFVVLNDIIWDDNDANSQFIAKPWVDTSNPAPAIAYYSGSTFSPSASAFGGVFDGMGHKIEFGIMQAGLFGVLYGGAVVKNASFIVKKVETEGRSNYLNYMTGKYSILAAAATNFGGSVTVENVYATYDMNDFTPELTALYDGTKVFGTDRYSSDEKVKHYNGLGLIGAETVLTKFKNVIVDMTKVKGVDEAIKDTTKEVHFGIFGGFYLHDDGRGYAYKEFTNCYVIWDVPMIAFCRVNETAANGGGLKLKYAIRTYADGESGTNAYSDVLSGAWVSEKTINYTLTNATIHNLTRVNDYSALPNAATAVLTSLGISLS